MLLTFPQLVTFHLFAPLFLRYALVFFFLLSGIQRLAHAKHLRTIQSLRSTFLKKYSRSAVWGLGVCEVLMAGLFAIGLYTQVVGALAALYAVKSIVLKDIPEFKTLAEEAVFTYVFVFAIGICLLLLGPGVFSLDLPL